MDINITDKLLITPAEAAALTGISAGTVLRWCKERKPFVTRVGRNYKISLGLFRVWLDEKCMSGEDLVAEKEM
jgi:excisionase family DNA binding protein